MLHEKVIILTGGSGLIGSSIMKFCQEAGAIAINADIGVETSVEYQTFRCDVTNAYSVNQLIEFTLENFKRIDGLVNNAYPRTKDWGVKFESIPVESWRENIDMQLNSTFICCQAVLKIMAEQRSGSIVNISSIYGSVGPDFTIYAGTGMTMPAAYSAIKGGVINFARYLASYYGEYNVRVNCVSPGGIWDNQNELFVKQYEEKVPMRRMGSPDDIAPSVIFLLSDNAAYITGHNLVVDGGWTCI